MSGDSPPELGQLDAADRGLGGRQCRHDVPRAMPGEIRLGLGDEVEHALVRLARSRRRRRPGHEDDADGLRRRSTSKLACHGLGEIEPRHQVRDDDHRLAIELADALFAARRVGDREHRVGMRVIDEPERHAAVEDRLDRGHRCGRPQHVGDELVHHVRAGQPIESGKLEHVIEPHRREARRFDELEVPAAALHVEDGQLVAEAVALDDLHRRVAAAVEHERLVAAEQARVYTRAEIASNAASASCQRLCIESIEEGRELHAAAGLAPPRMIDAISIRIVSWPDARGDAMRVREAVFVVEQGVPPEIELDEWDAQCDTRWRSKRAVGWWVPVACCPTGTSVEWRCSETGAGEASAARSRRVDRARCARDEAAPAQRPDARRAVLRPLRLRRVWRRVHGGGHPPRRDGAGSLAPSPNRCRTMPVSAPVSSNERSTNEIRRRRRRGARSRSACRSRRRRSAATRACAPTPRSPRAGQLMVSRDARVVEEVEQRVGVRATVQRRGEPRSLPVCTFGQSTSSRLFERPYTPGTRLRISPSRLEK